MKGTFYVDSNVFLYPVLYNELEESKEARKILSQIKKNSCLYLNLNLGWGLICSRKNIMKNGCHWGWQEVPQFSIPKIYNCWWWDN